MELKGKKYRHELKFLINYIDYEILRSRLSAVLARDKNSGKRGYLIRSLYFDDMYNSGYEDKIGGILHRKKYRIRIYNGSKNQVKLERKEKFGEYISKSSASINPNEFYNILKGNSSFLISSKYPAARDFYLAQKTKLLAPRVIVDYNREAYVHDEGNVRITFDKDLRAGISSYDIFDDKLITVPAIEQGTLIMEVKFDDFLPSFIREAIKPSASVHMALSKYVMCMDSKKLYKWKDVLYVRQNNI